MKKATFKKTLRGELYKLFHHKLFWIALAVGMVLNFLDLLENWQNIQKPIQWVIEKQQEGVDTYLGYSVFSNWIALGGGTYAAGLYVTLWPILVAMVFGWSYNQDRMTGVYNQLASRVGLKRYFRAKHAAVFIGGGLVFAVPIFLNLLAMALIWPAVGRPGVFDTAFLAELAAVSSWGYCFAVCGMCFLWGGATACICHCVGTFLRHGVMVVLVPYALYIAIDTVITVWAAQYSSPLYQLSPRLLGLFHNGSNPGWLQFSYLILFTVGSYLLGLRQVRKQELI